MICSCNFCFRLSDKGRVLGLPLLAVVGFTVLCSRSRSLTLSLVSSTGLNPVSMLSVNFIPSSSPASAMSICIFSLVGNAMFLAGSRYRGKVHVMP